MLQAYPGSNPVRDVLTGRISLRQFRVMVEHLPPGNVLERERAGGSRWGDMETLVWGVESRLRELVAMFHNVHRPEGEQPVEVEYISRPSTRQDEELARAQAEYDALMMQQLEDL